MYTVLSASFVPSASFSTSPASTSALAATIDTAADRSKFNGKRNPGSPLYIPEGVAVEFALPPPIHRISAPKEENGAAASPSSSTPDIREFDGVLNKPSPLFVPKGAALPPLSLANCSAASHSSSVPTSSDGVLNLQLPLFVAPGIEFIPATVGATGPAPEPKPENRPATASPEPAFSSTDGTLNVPSALFVPSPEEQKQAAAEREARFWEEYWAKEHRRLQMLAASVFPEPLPRPAREEEDDDRPAVPKAPPNSSQWSDLIHSVVNFIGI